MKIPLHWVSVWVLEKGTTDPYICLKTWDLIHSDWSAAPLSSIWFPRVLDFPGGSAEKKSPARQEPQEMWVWSLGWEDPLEEDMATHSGIPAWRIPWTEEPGGLPSTGSERIGHDRNNLACIQPLALVHVLKAYYENESYYPLKEKIHHILTYYSKIKCVKSWTTQHAFSAWLLQLQWRKSSPSSWYIFYNEGDKKRQREISESLTTEMHVHILHRPAVIIILREALGR